MYVCIFKCCPLNGFLLGHKILPIVTGVLLDAVWGLYSGGPKKPCISWGQDLLS